MSNDAPMPEVTSQEKDTAIATWLEPRPDGRSVAEISWKSIYWCVPSSYWRYEPLDFATDQNASALIRKKLREIYPFLDVSIAPARPGYGIKASMEITGEDFAGHYLQETVFTDNELEFWRDVAYLVATGGSK